MEHEYLQNRKRYYKAVLNDPEKEYTDEDVVQDSAPHGESLNIVSSLCEDGYHRPALDIDIPCFWVESSTPGHGHLYINTPMTWSKYEALLVALGDAGILEQGYVAASLEREATYLRLPWVKKKTGEDGSDGTLHAN